MIHLSLRVDDFFHKGRGRWLLFPIKVEECGSYFGKDDLFFFLCNCFFRSDRCWECLPIPLEAR